MCADRVQRWLLGAPVGHAIDDLAPLSKYGADAVSLANLQSPRTQTLSPGGVAGQVGKSRSESRHVLGWYQQSILVVTYELARAAIAIETHSRHTHAHGFEQRVSKTLKP